MLLVFQGEKKCNLRGKTATQYLLVQQEGSSTKDPTKKEGDNYLLTQRSVCCKDTENCHIGQTILDIKYDEFFKQMGIMTKTQQSTGLTDKTPTHPLLDTTRECN